MGEKSAVIESVSGERLSSAPEIVLSVDESLLIMEALKRVAFEDVHSIMANLSQKMIDAGVFH
jgi:hypothetical protein